MDVQATTKYARMAPSKGRSLARRVQGLAIAEALSVTRFTPGKAARLLDKTLRSAVANAENNANLPLEDLKVKLAVFEDGPRMKRYWPRARGGASPVKKRPSHVRIILTDGKNEEAEE